MRHLIIIIIIIIIIIKARSVLYSLQKLIYSLDPAIPYSLSLTAVTNPLQKIFKLFLDAVANGSQQLDNVERIEVAPLHVEAVATKHANTAQNNFSFQQHISNTYANLASRYASQGQV